MYHNSDINAQARYLYRKNFKLFIPYILVMILFSCATAAVVKFLGTSGPYQFFANIFIETITYPIMTIGLARVTLSVWRQEPVCAKDIFMYCRNAKLFRTALGIGAIYTIVSGLLELLVSIPSPLLSICGAVANIYFIYHFVLAPYIFISDHASGSYDCVSLSIECMKGRSWDYFKFYFSLLLFPMIISIALVIASFLMFANNNFQLLFSDIWPALVALCIITLLSPYFSIAVSGYFDAYLQDKTNF